MHSKLHKLSPILWTKDLKATTEFYEKVLGFKSRSNFPNFVSLSREEVEIMFIVPLFRRMNLKNVKTRMTKQNSFRNPYSLEACSLLPNM